MKIPEKSSGGSRAFPDEGFVRLKQILGPNGPIPISRSRWYQGVARGEFPAPTRLGTVSLYDVRKIRALIDRLSPRSSDDEAIEQQPRQERSP